MVVIKKDFEENLNKWVGILEDFQKEMHSELKRSEITSHFEEGYSSVTHGLKFLKMTVDLIKEKRVGEVAPKALRIDEEGGEEHE